MRSIDLPATRERCNRRRVQSSQHVPGMTAFRSTLLCKCDAPEQLAALGRIAWIVRIATIRGEPLDELDNRIAVARLKSDESLQ